MESILAPTRFQPSKDYKSTDLTRFVASITKNYPKQKEAPKATMETAAKVFNIIGEVHGTHPKFDKRVRHRKVGARGGKRARKAGVVKPKATVVGNRGSASSIAQKTPQLLMRRKSSVDKKAVTRSRARTGSSVSLKLPRSKRTSKSSTASVKLQKSKRTHKSSTTSTKLLSKRQRTPKSSITSAKPAKVKRTPKSSITSSKPAKIRTPKPSITSTKPSKEKKAHKLSTTSAKPAPTAPPKTKRGRGRRGRKPLPMPEPEIENQLLADPTVPTAEAPAV